MRYTRRIASTVALLAPLAIVVYAAGAWAHSSGGPPLDDAASHIPLAPVDPGTFINFETPHVHPIDISPDSETLAVCNTPDGRVEIYDIDDATGLLTHTDSIRVGYDPVTARFVTATDLWVVNRISDSISIVNVPQGRVGATIDTQDEPADVVFYFDSVNSSVLLAAVSCSRLNTIQVFHASARTLVDEFTVLAHDPRALQSDGTHVYVAPFAGGNGTTLLLARPVGSSPLDDPTGPYGGQNPPYNNGIPGTAWVTPLGADNFSTVFASPPKVGLIVRKDVNGVWFDDNGANWTEWISGSKAAMSRRMPGWDLSENDIGKFRTLSGRSTLVTTFGENGWARRRMTNDMALARNPANGNIILVGTESSNHIRFEPVLKGRFMRSIVAIVDGISGAPIALRDMNVQHLAAAQGGLPYQDGSVPQSARNKSIGDPRGVAVNPDGTRIYVTGMGSGNIVVINPTTGFRLVDPGYTIDLGSPTPGPTGIVHHPTLNRLYVVNRFASTVMTIDSTTLGGESIIQELPFFDPTPAYINAGRDDFYDTHQNSGLGQIACASCHIDARTDRLAWDLGNPQGSLLSVNLVNPSNPVEGDRNLLFEGFGGVETDEFHDMKGPMTTQTLIDIIGKEPFHWRGDRDGIEDFAGAWQGLQGADAPLGSIPMQEVENFLSSLYFGPNPFRALDNSLPGGPQFIGGGTNPDLPLEGYFSDGPSTKNPNLLPKGTPLPDGNAFRGLQLYVQGNPSHVNPTPNHDLLPTLDREFQCVTCHALPTGNGPAKLPVFNAGTGLFDFVSVAPGPKGEAHTGLIPMDGGTGTTGSGKFGALKIPQLRDQLDTHGFSLKFPNTSTLGFGVLRDGRVDDIDSFIGSAVFDLDSSQDVADLVAFTLCINGDDFAEIATQPGAPTFFSPPELPINLATVGQLGPEGAPARTVPASVGKQVTINSPSPPSGQQARLDILLALAQSGRIDLIAYGMQAGERRSWYRWSGTTFLSDRAKDPISLSGLMALAAPGAELTFMAVPAGLGVRTGVDRDEDGGRDGDETILGADPANPDDNVFVGASIPPEIGALHTFSTVQAAAAAVTPTNGKRGVIQFQGGDYAGPVTITKRVVLKKIVDPTTAAPMPGIVRIGV